jgi:nitroreductase
MPNTAIDVIFTRRSVRAYTGQQPDDAAVELLAKAALAAPSGGNKQPVTVIVVRNAALIQELERAVIAGFEKKGETAIVERIKSRNGKIFYDAPVSYFLAVKDKALVDVGIAAQNIAIAASALGLGSIILGLPGIAFTDPETSAYWKDRLGFPPGYEFGIAVAAGFAADSGKPHEVDLQKIKYAGE